MLHSLKLGVNDVRKYLIATLPRTAAVPFHFGANASRMGEVQGHWRGFTSKPPCILFIVRSTDLLWVGSYCSQLLLGWKLSILIFAAYPPRLSFDEEVAFRTRSQMPIPLPAGGTVHGVSANEPGHPSPGRSPPATPSPTSFPH